VIGGSPVFATGAAGVPIARLFGIEIRVGLGWVLVLAFIGALAVNEIQQIAPDMSDGVAWGLGALVAGGFFVSSVAHDLVHAVVARRRGVSVPAIAVSFFGGATPLDPVAMNAVDDLAIAASGPVASLGIAAVCGGLAVALAPLGGLFEAMSAAFATLLVLNVLLGGINLVPAYPLDGGRIVRALAWRRTGSERSGWRIAAQTGRFAGFAAILLGGVMFVFVNAVNGAMVALSGWFLVLSARTIRDRMRVDELIGDLHVRDAMDDSNVTVHPSLTLDTFADQLLDRESPTTAVPVTDEDRVVGLVGLRQIQRLRRDKWPATRVADVMVRPPRLSFLGPDDSLADAVLKLQRANTDGLPVLDAGQLIGVLSRFGVGKVLTERMARTGTPAR
jgi:Zn-dependent protease/predicted transcriptional regulator